MGLGGCRLSRRPFRWRDPGRKREGLSQGPRKNAKIDPQCLHDVSRRLRDLGVLEYGKVVNIGNPLDPNSRGRLCAKGIAGLNHLYNPDRIPSPLRRVGSEARADGSKFHGTKLS